MNQDEKALVKLALELVPDSAFTFETDSPTYGPYSMLITTVMRIGETGRTLVWHWPLGNDEWRDYEHAVIRPTMIKEFKKQ